MERYRIHIPLTDKELIQKAYWWVDELIKSGGKEFVMHVPAQLNHDTDLVLFNTVKRFSNLLEKFTALQTKYDNILATEDGHESQTENVWQSGFAAGHDVATEKYSQMKERAEKMEQGIEYAKIRLKALLPADEKQVAFIFEKVTEALAWKEEQKEVPATQKGAIWITGQYDRLYDQLKAEPERRIVCYVDYKWRWRNDDKTDSEGVYRDICTIRGERMEFSSRGNGYGGADLMLGWYDEKIYFLQECEKLHVQWLDEQNPTP